MERISRSQSFLYYYAFLGFCSLLSWNALVLVLSSTGYYNVLEGSDYGSTFVENYNIWGLPGNLLSVIVSAAWPHYRDILVHISLFVLFIIYAVQAYYCTVGAGLENDDESLYRVTFICSAIAGLSGNVFKSGIVGLASSSSVTMTRSNTANSDDDRDGDEYGGSVGLVMTYQAAGGVATAFAGLIVDLYGKVDKPNDGHGMDAKALSIFLVMAVIHGVLCPIFYRRLIVLHEISDTAVTVAVRYSISYEPNTDFIKETDSMDRASLIKPLLEDTLQSSHWEVDLEDKLNDGNRRDCANDDDCDSEAASLFNDEDTTPTFFKRCLNTTKYNYGSLRTLWKVVKRTFAMEFSVFYVFAITLSIFPNFIRNILPPGKDGEVEEGIPDPFVPMLILIYNILDMAGRAVANKMVMLPLLKGEALALMDRRVVWAVLLRTIFIPAFLFCNVRDTALPVIFKHPAWPLVLVALFAGSNGYLCSMAMIVAPVKAGGGKEGKYLSGVAMTIFLGVGLICGSHLSFSISALSKGKSIF
mmetsp:Transcript_14129/g.30913  ORF Transcript_14129/g.30913 Transcript_14129/m.30913 type:complete len:529 (-) Transcript_14129:132-1718(-)